MSKFLDAAIGNETVKEDSGNEKTEKEDLVADVVEDQNEEEYDDNEGSSDAISADIAFVKTNVVNAAIVTITRDYTTVVIMRNQYSRLQLRVQYTPNYPNEVPIIEITSSSLPPPLLRNKAKEAAELAKEHLGSPQFQFIYEYIYSFVQTNLFLSCWKEVKQVASLCEKHGQIGLKEMEGIMQFRLKGSEGYFQNFNITVPYMYPEEPLVIEFLKSSFPEDMQQLSYAQAEALVARCVAGIPPDHNYQAELATPASSASTSSVALKGNKPGTEQPKVRLTTDSLKSLKHDVNVIKQMSDLRAVDKVKDKRNQFSAHSTQERRDARKDLRRLAKAEAMLDKAEQEKLIELEQNEMIALMGLKISETAIPSLLPVCQFLIKDYVVKLSSACCQACNAPVLPSQADRTAAATAAESGKKKKKGAKNMKHIRANCGHWLHHYCLDVMLTTPPFLHHCKVPSCQRKIGHPDWSDDVKHLERAWLLEQAKKRELADVSDFLDVGSEFTR